MTGYLAHGWYTDPASMKLRPEVVDGAMDTAGVLLRAGVAASQVGALALKCRALAAQADPLLQGDVAFQTSDRAAMAASLAREVAGANPTLDALIKDLLASVQSPQDLRAVYLHLTYITRMMQLLEHARVIGAVAKKKVAKKKVAKKKVAKKKVAKKKVAKKKVAKKKVAKR